MTLLKKARRTAFRDREQHAWKGELFVTPNLLIATKNPAKKREKMPAFGTVVWRTSGTRLKAHLGWCVKCPERLTNKQLQTDTVLPDPTPL